MSVLFGHILLLLLLVCPYKVICQLNNVGSRIYPGCSLINSTIYCFGGYTKFNSNTAIDNKYNNKYYGEQYKDPVNENIALDLSQFNNFTNFDTKKIQWQKKSSSIGNTPLESIGYAAAVPIYEDDSYLLYGGQVNDALTNLNNPFLNYNPQKDIWKSLPLPNGNNYTSGAAVINLGNDTIWIWGGTINNSQANVSDIVNIYDYKKNLWTHQIVSNGVIRTGHATTLTANGFIYLMGGIFKLENDLNFYYVEFQMLRKYDTKALQWIRFNATGDIPTKRVSHSITQSPDSNLLLLYGGVFIDGDEVHTLQDTYYVYNIVSNSFQYVPISSPTTSISRFGHFATYYSPSYLLLLFGFTDATTPAENINILDINDPYRPYWITTNSFTTTEPNNDLPSEKLIPIVVCISVVVIVVVIAFIYYIRYKKHKQKNEFVLEQDPRKNAFIDVTSQETSTDYNRALAKPYDGTESTTVVGSQSENIPIPLKKVSNKGLLPQQNNNNKKIKPSEPHITYSKPDSMT
ncbi:unnamed protein product [Cunninghamella echinulata]